MDKLHLNKAHDIYGTFRKKLSKDFNPETTLHSLKNNFYSSQTKVKISKKRKGPMSGGHRCLVNDNHELQSDWPGAGINPRPLPLLFSPNTNRVL